VSPLCAMASSGPAAYPAQRSLARRRVILSRRVLAYYDLIRGSGTLPPTFLVGIRRVIAARLLPRASLLLSACPFFRAAFRTSVGWSELTVEAFPSTVAFA
jgi:hypothetical protein